MLQGSTGKKFTAGGGVEEVLCEALACTGIRLELTLGSMEEGITHGSNLKFTEPRF